MVIYEVFFLPKDGWETRDCDGVDGDFQPRGGHSETSPFEGCITLIQAEMYFLLLAGTASWTMTFAGDCLPPSREGVVRHMAK